MIEYPPNSKFLVVLSGGLDSTIATALLVKQYGTNQVSAVSYYYGQRQKFELEKAKETCDFLGISHTVFDLSVLKNIATGFSANVDTQITMPTIREVIGDPRPVTYVPNRNMILLALSASFAEVNKIDFVVCGLQVRDEYSYHDTTPEFVEHLNNALALNRIQKISIIAPFNDMKKSEEIAALINVYGEDDGMRIISNTLTCYNPDDSGASCGICPSCSERLRSFKDIGLVDPIQYKV